MAILSVTQTVVSAWILIIFIVSCDVILYLAVILFANCIIYLGCKLSVLGKKLFGNTLLDKPNIEEKSKEDRDLEFGLIQPQKVEFEQIPISQNASKALLEMNSIIDCMDDFGNYEPDASPRIGWLAIIGISWIHIILMAVFVLLGMIEITVGMYYMGAADFSNISLLAAGVGICISWVFPFYISWWKAHKMYPINKNRSLIRTKYVPNDEQDWGTVHAVTFQQITMRNVFTIVRERHTGKYAINFSPTKSYPLDMAVNDIIIRPLPDRFNIETEIRESVLARKEEVLKISQIKMETHRKKK